MNQSDKIKIDAPNKTIEIEHPTQGTDQLTLYGGYAFFIFRTFNFSSNLTTISCWKLKFRLFFQVTLFILQQNMTVD